MKEGSVNWTSIIPTLKVCVARQKEVANVENLMAVNLLPASRTFPWP
jgi:hypothetical protein